MLNRRNFILSALAACVAGLWPRKAQAKNVRTFPVRDLKLTGPDHFGAYEWKGRLPVQNEKGDTVSVFVHNSKAARDIGRYLLIEASDIRYVDGQCRCTLGVVWRDGTPESIKARYPWACRA